MLPIAPRNSPYTHPSQRMRFMQSSPPIVNGSPPMRHPSQIHALGLNSRPSPLGTGIQFQSRYTYYSPTPTKQSAAMQSSPPMVITGSPMQLSPQTHAFGMNSTPSPPGTGIVLPISPSQNTFYSPAPTLQSPFRYSSPSLTTPPTFEQMFTSPMQRSARQMFALP